MERARATVRDHRVASRGRLSSERLVSLAPRTFSSGLGLRAPLYIRHQSDLVVCRLETSWNRCLSPPTPAGFCPSCPRTGSTPQRRSKPMYTPAGRTDAAPHAGRSLGGTSHPEFHDLPPATVVRLALQEAAPAATHLPAPESGWATGPPGASPGAFPSHDGPGAAA